MQNRYIEARKLHSMKFFENTMTLREAKKQTEIMERVTINKDKKIQEMLDLVFEEGYALGFKEGIDSVFSLEEK
jgi:hypothetical protein